MESDTMFFKKLAPSIQKQPPNQKTKIDLSMRIELTEQYDFLSITKKYSVETKVSPYGEVMGLSEGDKVTEAYEGKTYYGFHKLQNGMFAGAYRGQTEQGETVIFEPDELTMVTPE